MSYYGIDTGRERPEFKIGKKTNRILLLVLIVIGLFGTTLRSDDVHGRNSYGLTFKENLKIVMATTEENPYCIEIDGRRLKFRRLYFKKDFTILGLVGDKSIKVMGMVMPEIPCSIVPDPIRRDNNRTK